MAIWLLKLEAALRVSDWMPLLRALKFKFPLLLVIAAVRWIFQFEFPSDRQQSHWVVSFREGCSWGAKSTSRINVSTALGAILEAADACNDEEEGHEEDEEEIPTIATGITCSRNPQQNADELGTSQSFAIVLATWRLWHRKLKPFSCSCPKIYYVRFYVIRTESVMMCLYNEINKFLLSLMKSFLHVSEFLPDSELTETTWWQFYFFWWHLIGARWLPFLSQCYLT